MRSRFSAVALVAALSLLLASCSGSDSGGSDAWTMREPPLTTPWTEQVNTANALPEYPRPQLARPTLDDPTWLNLNGEWQYQPWDGASEIPFGSDLSQRILVPFAPESALSGIQAYSEYSLYRTTVEVPAAFLADGQRVRLHFGAVNHYATVYVNGTEVTQHSGTYDSFSADITDALAGEGAQEIIVAVHSPIDAENIPIGKQRLKPEGIFYTSASGIWQTVWLEPVDPVSISSVTAVPDVTAGQFVITAAFNGDAAGTTVTVEAFADGVSVGSASGPAESPLTLAIDDPRLWSPEDPFLYTLVATLDSGDSVESYAGLREIAVEQINGTNRITLNGQQTYLLGTLDQGYWPDGIYTAPTDEALRFDIEQTKELGFNTIRKHIKVEPARWYYWADVLGMMVWQDIPAMTEVRNDQISEDDQDNFRDEAVRIVHQLEAAPSVIGWVGFNEGWGQWSVPAAKEIAAALVDADPTRLVIARSGSNCCLTPGDPYAGDVISWHAYQGPAFPSPDRDRAAIDGEHGGLTLAIEGHSWSGQDMNPYGSVADQDALNAGYVENTAALRDWGPNFGISGSIYTQITDVETEQNGFFTYDRQVLKVDPEIVRAINLETIEAGSAP